MTYRDRGARDWPQRLKARQRQSGKTYRRIAEDLGVSESLVSHWLNGRRDPSIIEFLTLCQILDEDPAPILFTDLQIAQQDLKTAIRQQHETITRLLEAQPLLNPHHAEFTKRNHKLLKARRKSPSRK